MRSGARRSLLVPISLTLLAGLCAVTAALLSGVDPPGLNTACLMCIWRNIQSGVRTAIVVLTSLDAIGGMIGAAAGERIGGAFGRGVGRSLGQKYGSGEFVGLATGAGDLLTGAQTLGGWAQGQVTGKIKGGLRDQTLDYMLGEDKASRQQEAQDWFRNQIQ